MPERVVQHVAIYPASHYVASKEKMARAMHDIEEEMWQQVKFFESHDKLLEAQRIRQRTQYDLEMLSEIGFCTGIENYSRVIAGRAPGTPPTTLIDYFPDDFLLFVDESHVTLPQVRAMYNGDHSRKQSLVDYGFRLPSAYDNRPLKFDEFEAKIHQAIFVSATPGDYEREHAANIAEQLIRPTGLLDPEVFIRPIEGQIDDLIGEINATTAKGERTLVTTLTKKMAEDLTKYLTENGIRVRYMHSDIGAMERMEIIRDLRMAKFDVLIGINLLREGLDLPEVSLIAILDADKEGFLRSETSLIQTIGRAARNAEGRVLLYADKITPAMRAAMDETARRRQIQDAYNQGAWHCPENHRQIRPRPHRNFRHPDSRAQGQKRREDDEAGAPAADREAGEEHARGREDDGVRVCGRAAGRDHPASRRGKSSEMILASYHTWPRQEVQKAFGSHF